MPGVNRKLIFDLLPFTSSYEYAAEAALSIRDLREDLWVAFTLDNKLSSQMDQAYGFEFMHWLETHIEQTELTDLIYRAFEQLPSYMHVELAASHDCIDRSFAPIPRSIPASSIDSLPASLIVSEYAVREIDKWTEEALQHADLKKIYAEPADKLVLKSVHSSDYCNGIESLAATGGGYLTPETAVTEETLEETLASAGIMIHGVQAALDDHIHGPILCRTHPGSHHAATNRGGGTCLINNLAIGAMSALRSVDRVAIIDIDAHHGNGTEQIFFEDERVFTFSAHQKNPFFPGTGNSERSGSGPGQGYNLNVEIRPDEPWGQRVIDGLSAVERFRPELILVEYSSDAHVYDPVSDLCAEAKDFENVCRQIFSFGVPVVFELGASLSRDAWIDAIRAVVKSAQ